MSFPIQTLVINPAGDEKHTVGPLDAQVRLVNQDGTAFPGTGQHVFNEMIGNANSNVATTTTANPTKDEYNKLVMAFNALAAQFNTLVTGLAEGGLIKLPDKK